MRKRPSPNCRRASPRRSTFSEACDKEQFAGADTRTVTLKVAGKDMSISGRDYLKACAMPNFYFHLTTAYNILRHNGVELGKRDFMGRA